MFVVWGEKLYGKVDQVPGLFYVTTRFTYIQYFPIYPMATMLMMDEAQDGGSARGCQIELSHKSVLFAWLRAALVAGALWLLLAAFVNVQLGATAATCIGFAVSAVAVLLLYGLSYRFSRAGAARALRLASEAGIPPEVVARAFVANGFRPPDPQDSAPEVRADNR